MATGQVNEDLLRQVCEITGGEYLESAEEVLELKRANSKLSVEISALTNDDDNVLKVQVWPGIYAP